MGRERECVGERVCGRESVGKRERKHVRGRAREWETKRERESVEE